MKTIFYFLFPLQSFAFSPGYISVSGECHRSLDPDRGRISMSIQIIQPTLKGATERSTKIYEAAVADIKKLGLRDLELQTMGYNTGVHQVYENNKLVNKGFQSTVGLTVNTSEIAKIPRVMEIAVNNGMTNTSDLQTFVSEERKRTEYMSCIDEAIKNARVKADKMAQAAGAKIGEVSAMSEKQLMLEAPQPFDAPKSMMMESRAGSSPVIETAKQKLSVEIHVMYKLK